jgi:hypothetical protein
MRQHIRDFETTRAKLTQIFEQIREAAEVELERRQKQAAGPQQEATEDLLCEVASLIGEEDRLSILQALWPTAEHALQEEYKAAADEHAKAKKKGTI